MGLGFGFLAKNVSNSKAFTVFSFGLSDFFCLLIYIGCVVSSASSCRFYTLENPEVVERFKVIEK